MPQNIAKFEASVAIEQKYNNIKIITSEQSKTRNRQAAKSVKP